MPNSIFNPFGILDKAWSQKVIPWSILGLLGFLLVISILDPMLPTVHALAIATNIYTACTVAILLLGAPLLFYWLSGLTQGATASHLRLRDTEATAIQSVLASAASAAHESLDMCCYTGPTFVSSISNLRLGRGSFSKTRLLLRHPAVPFRIPRDPERARQMRERIITDINHYEQLLEEFSDSVEIRGYPCEPSLRAMLVNRRAGFFSLYTTSSRKVFDRMTIDYVSRDKPVIEFGVQDDIGIFLMTTIQSRFEDMWRISCPIYPKPVVVFDFDGTICESLELHSQSWDAALEEIGIGRNDPRAEEIRARLNMGLAAPDILRTVGLGNVDKPKLVTRKREIYEDLLGKKGTLITDNTQKAILALFNKRYTLAIATTASKSIVEPMLSQTSLLHCFTTIVCREDVEQTKPAADVMRRICKTLGTPPETIVFVGDSPSDQLMANDVGTCFVRKCSAELPGSIGDLGGVAPFATISSLSGLLDILCWSDSGS